MFRRKEKLVKHKKGRLFQRKQEEDNLSRRKGENIHLVVKKLRKS